MTAYVLLKPNREKSLLRHHPWVFSGAIQKISDLIASGETVRILDKDGQFLAWGAYSPHSQISVRVWSWQQDEIIDEAFFLTRITNAIQSRQDLINSQTTDSVRLIHGESDRLPGLIVDQYAHNLVVQFLSAGVEYWRSTIIKLIIQASGIQNIYERSDVDVRQLENLPIRQGALHGDPPFETIIHENGIQYFVDITSGHKTGFYLDQRANRKLLRTLSKNRDVLDCFCYTGGFTLNALAGGAASVLAIDSSPEALTMLERNRTLNDQSNERLQVMQGDVFQLLRKLRDQARSFDLIILDPPKFAPTAAQAQRAARGYKDINLLAFKLLRPGGLLLTFSCSGGVDAQLFQKIVAGAALDAGIEAQILAHLFQDRDHPVTLNFPEGSYLKGLLLKID
jgi:23S rRNA (cytosine1962-C5)-methyltransferase